MIYFDGRVRQGHNLISNVNRFQARRLHRMGMIVPTNEIALYELAPGKQEEDFWKAAQEIYQDEQPSDPARQESAKRTRQYQERLDAFAKECFDIVNVIGGEDEVVEALINQVTKTHRTLQQSFMRVLVQYITEYGKVMNVHTDARNEAAVKFAQDFAKQDHHFPLV